MKAYTGGSARKRYIFQASVILRGSQLYVMSKESIFANMRTGFSSLEIFQEKESAEIVRFEIP